MQELIRQFGVDWKLLFAQVVNFLILIYLLKRFAYGPIIAMLDERRKKIKEGMEASEQAKQALLNANHTRDQIILKAEQESVTIVSQAEDIAKIQAANVVKAAHAKSEQVIAQAQKQLAEDALKLNEEFELHAQALIKQGLVSTIGRMSPTERDDALIKDALRELTKLNKAVSPS